jgi:hypothetical protein
MKLVTCPFCRYKNADLGVHKINYLTKHNVELTLYLKCIRCDNCKNYNLDNKEYGTFRKLVSRSEVYTKEIIRNE